MFITVFFRLFLNDFYMRATNSGIINGYCLLDYVYNTIVQSILLYCNKISSDLIG